MSRQSVEIRLPLSDNQAKAIVLAAAPLGVEPWELGAYILQFRRDHCGWNPSVATAPSNQEEPPA